MTHHFVPSVLKYFQNRLFRLAYIWGYLSKNELLTLIMYMGPAVQISPVWYARDTWTMYKYMYIYNQN